MTTVSLHLDAHPPPASAARESVESDAPSVASVQVTGADLHHEVVVLVESARAGDKRSLRTLYDRFSRPVHRFLMGLMKSVPAAQDATQETFARAFTRLDTLKEPERVSAWLFGIARRVALESWKLERHAPVARSNGLEPESAGGSEYSTPESILLGREAATVVDETMSRLSDDRRTVLLLRVDHGLGYEAIASIMEWTVAKAKVEVHRARVELRAQIANYERGAR